MLNFCQNNQAINCQRRDREIAKLLITVVLVFIACHSLRMVLNIYEVLNKLLETKIIVIIAIDCHSVGVLLMKIVIDCHSFPMVLNIYEVLKNQTS